MRKPLILLCLLAPLLLAAQRDPIPLNLSLFNEATALPFTRFVTLPLHPGIQAGTEFDYRVGLHTRLFQTANAYYFHHAHLNQGIGLSTDLGWEYRHRTGLTGGALLGVGYLHSFNVAEEHVLVDGEYVQRADHGNARLTPSLSLELGYCLNRENLSGSKLFLRYQAWAEFPYSPGFIPLMTHINLHLGARIMIPRKEGGSHAQ